MLLLLFKHDLYSVCFVLRFASSIQNLQNVYFTVRVILNTARDRKGAEVHCKDLWDTTGTARGLCNAHMVHICILHLVGIEAQRIVKFLE